MSGGVDSSMAAALLVERGYHVQGLTMHLWQEPSSQSGEHLAIRYARTVCECLAIKHHVIDLGDAFLHQIVNQFVQEYAQGRTPNPCVRCNRLIKFGLLRDQARALGCEILATGHYARISQHDGTYHLLCGVDARKDQSYMLYALGQQELASALFPLGEYKKSEVRAMARQRGLPVADRPESQDICFLRDRDYRRFLAERLPEAIRPGPIYDRQGRLLGQHKGLPFYTVGQREGLGIAAQRPLYVLKLDMLRNALIVGFAEELGSHQLIAEEMSYVSGKAPSAGCAVEAKIRYRAPRVPAHVWPLSEGRCRVIFEQPLRDITPGQAVVLYQGEEVLGGGTISQSGDEPLPQ